MVEPLADLAYLYARLGMVEARLRAAVARRRAGDPSPDDAFRGLYVSDADVDRLLSAAAPAAAAPPPPDPAAGETLRALEARADSTEAGGGDLRLRRLARDFGLDQADVEMLLVALAPDLDARFEPLYGYLHDDVTRRRASTGLALRLCWPDGNGGAARRRLGPAGALVAGGVVRVEEHDRPFLTRPLRVPDRVAAHLLGDNSPDPAVARLLAAPVQASVGDIAFLMRALQHGGLVYVRDEPGAAGLSWVATAMARLGRHVTALDLERMGPEDVPADVAALAAREARLLGGVLVAGPVEVLAERGAGAVRAFAEAPCPLVLMGARTWDPRWSRHVALLVDAPVPSAQERRSIWEGALGPEAATGLDPAEATVQFRLTPDQVARAAEAATLQAAAAGRPASITDLQTGARAQNAAGLERLARRVEPRVSWNDLVLPRAVVAQLRELTARARHRERVLDEWGMGRRSAGRGITALFAGESGTGKTLSAEVVAADLGLHLYVIDLATVVDKYIGETEKNLDRIFDEADRVNGVLLFDEADAMFGKRSDVKDAHDRYANVEVAYLLQRMERFGGLAVLTTNLRANVDEAFTRRLDLLVDFPMPEEKDRCRLWDRHLAPGVPRADDLDLAFLGRSFKLSGGNIRNVALAAAFLAAADDRAVTMTDLVRATEHEYRKLGHLCLEAEFGPYFPLLAGSNGR